ncbi:hypothetical protein [Humidesulfovibrio idahonensis]
MSWKNGPWRMVARLTHLEAAAQRRLWRMLIFGWSVLLLASWAALSAFTRAEEKTGEEAGQTYVTVAPLAAEVMEMHDRKGQLEGQPPLVAAEQIARAAGVTPERLRIQLLSNQPAPSQPTPARSDTDPQATARPSQTLSLHAQGLTLRELVEVLRDLRIEAGLSTVSAHLAPTPGADNLMDLDMVLSR